LVFQVIVPTNFETSVFGSLQPVLPAVPELQATTEYWSWAFCETHAFVGAATTALTTRGCTATGIGSLFTPWAATVIFAVPAVSWFPLQTVALVPKIPPQISEPLMVTSEVFEEVMVNDGPLVSTLPLASTV